MKKNVTDEALERIITDKLVFDAKTADIAAKYNLSRSFVCATVAAFKDVQAGNWEHVRFMLDGAQVNLKVVEWAAARLGVTVPDSFYQKPEPKPAEPVGNSEQLEGQTKMPEFNEMTLQFSKGANNTVHALIDALNRNADETAQLRKAVFALLNTAAAVD